MFAHLHCHFFGSYSDSLLDPEKAAPFVRDLGQRSLSITDHGELAFCFPFYRACRASGIHPVIGCEVYFVENAQKSIERNDPSRNHLILLAKDNAGFLNLVRLLNAAQLENNFNQARGLVDWELLGRYHQGLIALTACFWGSVPQKYLVEGLEAAEKEFRRFYDIFGKDFYLELGRHGIEEEERANQGMTELARRYGLCPVVTNDCHYYSAEDWRAHDVLIKTRFGYPTDFEIDARNYYLKSEEEMLQLGFPSEFCRQTALVAEQCRVDLDKISFDYGEDNFDPGKEAVFPARLEVLDAGRALSTVASVLKQGKTEVDKIIPSISEGMDLSSAAAAVPRLEKLKRDLPLLYDLARKLEGIPRASYPDFENIIDLPLFRAREFLPLKRSDGVVMSQYPAGEIEKMGGRLVPSVRFCARSEEFRRQVERLSALQKARRANRSGDWSAARAVLKGILARDPEDQEAALLLADSFFFAGDYLRAIEEYSKLKEESLSRVLWAGVQTRTGWAYWRLGRRDQALESFRRASARGDYPAAYYALGVANFQMARLNDAARALRRFLELKPEGSRAKKARRLLSRCDLGLDRD